MYKTLSPLLSNVTLLYISLFLSVLPLSAILLLFCHFPISTYVHHSLHFPFSLLTFILLLHSCEPFAHAIQSFVSFHLYSLTCTLRVCLGTSLHHHFFCTSLRNMITPERGTKLQKLQVAQVFIFIRQFNFGIPNYPGKFRLELKLQQVSIIKMS